MNFDSVRFQGDLTEIVDHYDWRQDFVTHQECLNELDRIQRTLDAACAELERRTQEHKVQSTPVGGGTATFFRKRRGEI